MRVDRLRCAHCRNPVKPQHTTAGPSDGRDTFHEDCWELAQHLTLTDAFEQQLDYQRRVAAQGLSALLAPYLTAFPHAEDEPAPSSDPLPT
jgi:hypothetical protein